MHAAMLTSRRAALLVLTISAATIAIFLFSEHVLGYLPCPLCLQQRMPFYFAAPLAALIAITPTDQKRLRSVGLLLLALLFLISAGLGAFHAGVEWKFWPGPAGCSGQGSPINAADLLNQLQSVRVVSCSDAAFRVLGLSMAGWNMVVSLALAALAGAGAMADTLNRNRAAGTTP